MTENIYFFKRASMTQVDVAIVRNDLVLSVAEILPEHLESSDYCLVRDCEPVSGESWQGVTETFELGSDGVHQRVLTVQDLPNPANKLARAAHIAAARYEAEIAGIEIAGAPIPTDRHTQTVLTAMYVKAVANPGYTLNNFKTISGFVSLTAAEIIAIADAVHDHVQTCFDRESLLLAELENGDLVSGYDF